MKQLYLLCLLVTIASGAYAQYNATGLWQGKLNVGGGITLIFHINGDVNNIYSVGIDCPEQGVKDMKASMVSRSGDSIIIEVNSIRGSYRGKLVNDSTMEGNWIQGMTLPLPLKRINEVPEIRRPQTPQPPFPYHSEELVYFNKDRSIQYGATITIPNGKGPFPAILLITGSGQQNRDEEILGHKPFAVLADYLTRHGYIVLRVDDRGMGQTTGTLEHVTSRDFANDALVGLDYLKNRKETDRKRIGLLGHSEGGMIAEMLAAERKDIGFIILMAAPGQKITDLMAAQNEALLTNAGIQKDYVDAYLSLYRSLVASIMEHPSKEEALAAAGKLLDDWLGKTPRSMAIATTGIKDQASRENFLRSFVEQVGNDWFRYFLAFDPAPYLQKIKGSVLALNGDRDIQVVSSPNLQGIEAALKKGRAASYEVKEMKGLNHLFQHCHTCSVQEYGQLTETIAPEVLDTIGAWLDQVKLKK